MWTYLEQCYNLLSPPSRREWLRHLPLLLLTSVTELIGAAGVFALVASIAEPEALGSLPVVGPFLVRLGISESENARTLILVLVGSFYLLKSLVLAATEYSLAVASTRTSADLSVRLLSGYLSAPYTFHLQRNAADLVHTTTRLAPTTFTEVISALIHIAAESLVLLAILGVLLTVAPAVTLISTIFLAAVGGLMLSGMRRRSTSLGLQTRDLGSKLMREQTQALGTVDEIAVLRRGPFFSERFAEVSQHFADVRALESFFGALPRIVVETLFIVGALGATSVLMFSGVSGGRTVSLLGLFAYAGFRVIPSANRILFWTHIARRGRAGIDQIREDLDALEEARSSRASASQKKIVFSDRVEFRGVGFDYAPDAPPVLDAVDLELRRGESVAIVGPTGSGKSSLVRLLVGLLEPSQGEILIDSCPLSECLDSWRDQIGYVPQQVHLIDDSLRRNVAFGLADEAIDDLAVDRAIAMAGLTEMVAALHRGLATRVGDQGVRISGGERQRIGIARALYRSPGVLILDEATSSLDLRTEAEIIKHLSADHERTVVAVTHRLNSVADFDRMIFIQAGRVAAVGSYSELLATAPEFRRMALAEVEE